MKHWVTKTILGIVVGCATSAYAVDITISDKVYSGSGWYSNREDNETEPGTIRGQEWDLERMDLTGNKLSIVGGFNFKNGEQGFYSGDIFIDIDGNAVYGTDVFNGNASYQTEKNQYGYDYAIVFDRSSPTPLSGGVLGVGFSVYKIDANSTVITAHFRQNDGSNPFRLDTTGLTPIAGAGGTIDFSANPSLTAGLLGYMGNETHNVMAVDLSALVASENLDLTDSNGTLFHFTVGCGNDNIMGYANGVPDGGITVALLGLALLGLGTYQNSIRGKRK